MKYPYIKFYFRDWQANSELQTCSIEARGVWIEMMCIMAQSERFGYLERMGKAMDVDLIARLIRVDKATLNPIIVELESAGVFSRCDTTGAIYSRRMVKDSEQAERFAEFGKRGGNPSLKSSSKRIPIANAIPIPIPTEGLTLGVNPPLKPIKDTFKGQFDDFWSVYPKKIGKPKAKSAYLKALKTADHADIMAGLQKHINCDGWIKDDGKFIPHPTTWLNREGWNDQVIGGNAPSQQASDYERKNREFIERTNRMMDEIN